MLKPWAGRYGYLWYEHQSGGVTGTITLAQRYGMRMVMVKEADEGRLWHQTSDAEMQQYRNAGIVPVAWTYAYGTNPKAAADAIIHLCSRFDGVCIDAEAELRNAEGEDRSQTEVIDGMLGPVRQAIGWDYPLAVAPLPIPKYHSDLNYARWLDWGCDLLPQFYFNVLGAAWPVSRLFREWPFPMEKTYPTFGAYGDTGYSGDAGARYPTGEQLVEAEALAVDNGCPGVGYWRIDTIKADLWPFPFGEPYAGTPQEDDVSQETIDAIQAELVNLIAIAGGQEAAGDAGAGAAIRTAVNNIIAAYPPLGLDA